MQRMLFARLLLQDARVIVLDEPFNAIDAKTSADLLDLVRRWHGEKRTVIAALHDIDLVRANFPETLLLAREPVAWGDTRDGADAGEPAHARGACARPSTSTPRMRRADRRGLIGSSHVRLRSSPPSSSSTSCAARWSARSRWRSAPARSACS